MIRKYYILYSVLIAESFYFLREKGPPKDKIPPPLKNNEDQPTSDPVDRDSIDGVVNPAGEEKFVSSEEDGPGYQADEETDPGGVTITTCAGWRL